MSRRKRPGNPSDDSDQGRIDGEGLEWALTQVREWRRRVGNRAEIDGHLLSRQMLRLAERGLQESLCGYVILGCEWMFRLRTSGPQDAQIVLARIEGRLLPILGDEAWFVTEALAASVRKLLKNDVGAALVAKFGSAGVTRGSKAFDVHATSYRVDADVVAGFELRRYGKQTHLTLGRFPYDLGTRFYSDPGDRIDNWPDQQYDNGVEKNNATSNRYKFIVRALKRLRNEMADRGIVEAKPIQSYLIECLVWNASNICFGHARYYDDMRAVITSVWNGTRTDEACHEWGEVNELKYLFRSSQPWTRADANVFLEEAWRYVGFSA